MTNKPRIHNGERAVFSVSGVEETGKPHVKEWDGASILQHTQKLVQSECKPEYEIKNHNTSGENTEGKLLDIILGGDFFRFDTKSEGNNSKNKWTTSN